MRKTVIERELVKKNMIATVIDSDEIKEYIPEYTFYKKMVPHLATSFVHKESREIAEKLLNKLISERKNFIFESTMAKSGLYKRLLLKLKKQKFAVHCYIVDVPVSVEKGRMNGQK